MTLPAKIISWVEAALCETHGTHTLADVEKALLEGRLHLWVGERCFAVTEFVNYPQRRAFNIFLAGGPPGQAAPEFREIQHGMEAFARAGGASLFTHLGKLPGRTRRPLHLAWERIGRGFRATHIAMTKELTP